MNLAAMISSASNAATAPKLKCRICRCKLDEAGDDLGSELCASCKRRPEARRLGLHLAPAVVAGVPVPPSPASSAREFNEGDRALIRKVAGYMPVRQLLEILNERLFADLGRDALPYTMEQLHAEIGEAGAAKSKNGELGWRSLRKLLAQARRDGVLATITEQTINDFAVVFSLNAKQVLSLKDIVLQAAKEEA